MEGLVHRRPHLVVAAVVLAVSSLALPLARAEDDSYDYPVNVNVDTSPDAVVIEADVEQQVGGGTTSTGSSGPRCHLKEVDPADRDGDPELQWVYYAHMVPYYLICDDETKSIVWLDYTQREGAPPGPAVEPQDVAMRLRDRIPIPRVKVDINPGRGLVGAESWFWIEGYDGRPITDSTDAFGDRVQVEAQVTSYEWSFGDGATFVSDSPGRAYPQKSEVRHMYERSSAGLADGYTVVVDFVFSVRYRVNGGGWLTLPGITRSSQANYPVRESQAVIER